MLHDLRTRTARYRLLAPAFALLLVACGSTRPAVAPRAEELSDFVLILEEESNGQVSHSWTHATEFDLAQYERLPDTDSEYGRIVLASSRPRDCDQENIDCYRNCMKRRFPSSHDHIKRQDGSKGRFCAAECLKKLQECLKSQNSSALILPAVNEAVEWLKRNREQLLVGTIVIIAGVAFVTISAGAGAVVLAPVVLVAS